MSRDSNKSNVNQVEILLPYFRSANTGFYCRILFALCKQSLLTQVSLGPHLATASSHGWRRNDVISRLSLGTPCLKANFKQFIYAFRVLIMLGRRENSFVLFGQRHSLLSSYSEFKQRRRRQTVFRVSVYL